MRLSLLGLAAVVLADHGSLAFSPSLPFLSRGTASLSRCNGPRAAKVGAIGLRAVLGKAQVDAAPMAMDWNELGSKPWGSIETDFMYVSVCDADKPWTFGEVKPYGDLHISPRAGVINYGQGNFEGMKAKGQMAAHGAKGPFDAAKNLSSISQSSIRNHPRRRTCMTPFESQSESRVKETPRDSPV